MSNTIASGMTVDGVSLVIGAGNIISAFPNMSLMRATMSTSQSTPGSYTPTLINFDTKTFDLLSEFNTTSHLFVATYAGYYRITACVEGSTPTTGLRYLWWYLNGTMANNLCYISPSYSDTTVAGSDVAKLNAGDTVGIWYESNVADNVLNNYTRFIVERISR